MSRRIITYYGLGWLYLLLIHLNFGRQWGVVLIHGVPDAELSLIPSLYVFFFEVIVVLVVFDYPRELFYHQNLVRLIRSGSRVRSYLRTIAVNLGCILGVVGLLDITGLLIDRQLSWELLMLGLIQLLALCIQAAIQVIIEIRWSALAGMLIVIGVVMSMQAGHCPLLGLIHTCRLPFAWLPALVGELVVLGSTISIGAWLVRKQEVY